MTEWLYQDIFGDQVVLTDSVRATILIKHPEATDFISLINRVLLDPEEVRRSILYYRFEAVTEWQVGCRCS